MKWNKKCYYMNLETGELLTWAEMIKQAEEEYDFGDYTNVLELYDYYVGTNITVQE